MIQPRSRERNARRAAARQDLVLKRSPRRDPRALDFDLYALVRADTGRPVHPVPPSRNIFMLTMEKVEQLLDQARKPLDAPLPTQPAALPVQEMPSLEPSRSTAPTPLPNPSQPSTTAMRVPDTSAEWERLLAMRRRA